MMHRSRAYALTLLATFGLCIYIPLLATPLEVWRGSHWGTWKKRFNTQFGLRQPLLRMNSILRVKLLHSSTTSQVIVGSSGWLYFDSPRFLQRTTNSGATDVLESQWPAIFAREQRWLTSRHIPLLVVIAPDKQSIYPEYLPANCRHRFSPVFTDQALARVRVAGRLEPLDLRADLLHLKQHDLYFHTDSHWNQTGAFAAYQAISKSMERLVPAFQGLTENDVTRSATWIHGLDLARMLKLTDDYRERQPRVRIRTGAHPGLHPIPRLLVIGDSFSEALRPYLSESAGKATYSSNEALIKGEVEALRPTLVIHEIVERKL